MLGMVEIVGRGAALLAAIRAQKGQWINRAALAAATGKNLLSPNDRNWLERLEREGLIEVSTRPVQGPARFEYVYRAAEQPVE